MSGLFGKPKVPDIPKQEAAVEPVATVQEDASVARRRERKKLLAGGRRSTILSGTLSVLRENLKTRNQKDMKKRLGE